jgi:hypothetical protein
MIVKKFYDKMWEVLPVIWGILLALLVTIGGVAAVIFVTKLFLSLIGVI